MDRDVTGEKKNTLEKKTKTLFFCKTLVPFPWHSRLSCPEGKSLRVLRIQLLTVFDSGADGEEAFLVWSGWVNQMPPQAGATSGQRRLRWVLWTSSSPMPHPSSRTMVCCCVCFQTMLWICSSLIIKATYPYCWEFGNHRKGWRRSKLPIILFSH